MSKIISWVIKLGSEKVCVLKSLTKFCWNIFMEFSQILSIDNISLFLLYFETAIHIPWGIYFKIVFCPIIIHAENKLNLSV